MIVKAADIKVDGEICGTPPQGSPLREMLVREIGRMVVDGLSETRIAAELKIETHTVSYLRRQHGIPPGSAPRGGRWKAARIRRGAHADQLGS